MNRSLFFLLAALVCFVVCVLLATGVFTGSDFDAWLAGGLVAFTLAHLPVGGPLP